MIQEFREQQALEVWDGEHVRPKHVTLVRSRHATVQLSKFARLRTASEFASASFEVRKTSDGCIRNSPCEPTLSESDCEPDLGHHFPNTTYESMPSELDPRA
ncbi:hypothetical protein LXL04_004190 [Taraxacum kok-saghyz]